MSVTIPQPWVMANGRPREVKSLCFKGIYILGAKGDIPLSYLERFIYVLMNISKVIGPNTISFSFYFFLFYREDHKTISWIKYKLYLRITEKNLQNNDFLSAKLLYKVFFSRKFCEYVGELSEIGSLAQCING